MTKEEGERDRERDKVLNQNKGKTVLNPKSSPSYIKAAGLVGALGNRDFSKAKVLMDK